MNFEEVREVLRSFEELQGFKQAGGKNIESFFAALTRAVSMVEKGGYSWISASEVLIAGTAPPGIRQAKQKTQSLN